MADIFVALAANKSLLMIFLSASFDKPLPFYNRHLSSCSVVTCTRSPQLLTKVSAWG
jgi:hypothetical protein